MRRPCWRSAATGLIGGLAADKGPAISAFEHALDQSLRRLPIRPVLLGTVYDPTFGDVRATFSASRRRSRANHGRDNDVIARLAQRHGRLVDLHAHFLSGDPSWFAQTSRA